MAVVLQSDESNYFQAAGPLRRSHSQPKFGTTHTSFHTSASTSRINEIYHSHQSNKVFSDSALSSESSSPRAAVHSGASDLSSYAPVTLPTSSSSSSAYAATTDASAPSLVQRRRDRPLIQAPDLDDNEEEDADHYPLPQYSSVGTSGTSSTRSSSYFSRGKVADEDLEAPPSPRSGDSYSVSPNDNDTLTTDDPSHPVTPDFFEHADDDIALRSHPSRHVDYLSHNWKEEDIWESWKYIVARKGDYSNAARLENASWRTWMKSKNKLRTVSPETLNWLKDCDVTWLYGPLQTGLNSLAPPSRAESVDANAPKSPSNVKKPILKKRSMSEVMLQRSISTSSLVKQAAAAVQAQQKDGGSRSGRPLLGRAVTDYVTLPLSSRRPSPGNSSRLESSASSRLESPAGERKHIHFNEQVEQCIAVEIKGDDDDDFDSYRYSRGYGYGYDSDSENDAVMMKRTAIKKKRPVLRRNKNSTGTEKTIAMLPSTTLKYREDTPEPQELASAMKHSYRSPTLTPSSSQETLRPPTSSTSSSRETIRPSKKASGKKMFFDDDDEDEDDEENNEDETTTEREVYQSSSSRNRTIKGGLRSPPPRLGSPTSSSAASASSDAPPPHQDLSPSGSSSGSLGLGLKRTTSSGSLSAEPSGMRRTESGMFMPYEEGGDPPTAIGGLVGRVIDSVNTARDIAHVIWNVGWRK